MTGQLRHIYQHNWIYASIILITLLSHPISAQERYRKSPPYPDPLPSLNLPEIQTTVLDNGLTLSVVPRQNLPIISLRLLIMNGETSSPDSSPGLATFTANMLMKGAVGLSSSEVEETVDAVGGKLSTQVFPEYTVFSFSFLDEYFDQALDLLSRLVHQPAFSGQEIRNVKRTMYYDLARRNPDPEYIGKRLLSKILFKDHPYGKVIFDNDLINDLDRKDLLMFFDKFYLPNNAQLIVIGNLNLSTASKKISQYFNSWKGEVKEFYQYNVPPALERIKVCFVNVPKSKDTIIFMGVILPPKSNQDFFPLLVLNQVLGGTHLSRLFMNLRESKGYAYWAYSSMEFFKTCGVFFIRAKVRASVIYAAVQEILSEAKAISNRRIPSHEIEQAKSYLIGNYPLSIETYDDLCSWVSEIQAFKLGNEHWDKYYESIMYINSQEVFATAQRTPILNPVIVIVGDRDTTLENLRQFAEVEVYNEQGELQYKITKDNNEGK